MLFTEFTCASLLLTDCICAEDACPVVVKRGNVPWKANNRPHNPSWWMPLCSDSVIQRATKLFSVELDTFFHLYTDRVRPPNLHTTTETALVWDWSIGICLQRNTRAIYAAASTDTAVVKYNRGALCAIQLQLTKGRQLKQTHNQPRKDERDFYCQLAPSWPLPPWFGGWGNEAVVSLLKVDALRHFCD